MIEDFFYPFDGDGRQKIAPTLAPDRTDPDPVRKGQAREMIQEFVEKGVYHFAPPARYAWVIIAWANHQGYLLARHYENGYLQTVRFKRDERGRRKKTKAGFDFPSSKRANGQSQPEGEGARVYGSPVRTDPKPYRS